VKKVTMKDVAKVPANMVGGLMTGNQVQSD